ncbi:MULTISPECIES: hypothetical protein [Rhodobacterales]|nr:MULTISPECIES: hypothetical protein [Rhodobacterales]MDR6267197.1 flagellar biosynthesis protein FliQ [Roseobacter sp. N2S]
MSFHLLVLTGAVLLLALVVGVVLCIGWAQQRFDKNTRGVPKPDAPREME